MDNHVYNQLRQNAFQVLGSAAKNGSVPARATLEMVDGLGRLLDNGASIQRMQVLIFQTMQILEKSTTRLEQRATVGSTKSGWNQARQRGLRRVSIVASS